MGLGIYIHIPFCVKKCNYCDFNSSDCLSYLKKDYKKALISEIEKCPYNDTVDSVFIGGGTPTSIETLDLVDIISCINKKFKFKDTEFTVEVNPATLGFNGFCMLKNAGVNRISFGLQSAIDEELKMLGRIHSYDGFLKSYESARKAGFDNINVDLMFSLPNQTIEKWKYTLNTVLKLNPEHLSCYSLIIEEGTPFYNMKLNLPDEETDRAIYEYTAEHLKSCGFNHYEISNFAKVNKECRHNIKYWKRENYIGFGAGASSLYNNVRFENTKDIKDYIKGNKQTVLNLSTQDILSEYIFLRLRMTEGIDLAEFKSVFGFDFVEKYKDILNKYGKYNLLEVGTHLRLTLSGISVSNKIMSEFV